MKRYGSYKATKYTWLTEVPSHWKTQTLRSLTTVRSERRGEKEATLLSVYREYGVIIKSSRNDNHNVESEDLSNYKVVHKGDLVMNKMKMWQGSLGISNLDGVVSPAYIVCHINDATLNLRYLHTLLRSPLFKTYYNQFSYGVRVGQWDMHYEDFKGLEISIPPRDEQDQIVRYLDWQVSKINRLIAAKRKEIELLHEQFSAVINNAVSGYDSSVPKHDSGISLLGQIPQGWHIRPFSKIATVKSNLVDPALYKDMLQISPASIEKNTARILELCTVEQAGVSSPNHRFFKGQIIYSKIRPLLNKVIIAPFDGLCSADMYPIETVLNTEYLLFYLLSSSYLQQLSVTANRVKMPKINQEELGATLVLIPPEQEQREIVATIKSKCSKIQLLIEKIKSQIDAASDLRTRLVSDVVTGQIDVRGIEIPDYERAEEFASPDNTEDESEDIADEEE